MSRITDWEIARTSGQCSHCQNQLAEQQEYMAVLYDHEGQFVRVDTCLECWTDQMADECFSYWKTRIPKRQEKKRTFVDDDVLINLFLRLADEEEPERINFRFVLALILMRKRKLKYENSRKADDREYWQMRLTGSQDMHDVLNPRLDDEKIVQVQQQLGAILHDNPDDWADNDSADTTGNDTGHNE